MSEAVPVKTRRLKYPSGKKGHAVTALISMAILLGGFYGVGFLTSPPPNTNCPVGYQSAPGLTASDGSCVHLTVVINHQNEQFVNVGLLSEGFTANCYAFCKNGIIYTLDPTVLITNGGHGFEQCKVFGTTSSEICESGDSAVIIGLSSAGVSPVSTDYSATGPCTTTASGNYVFSGTSSGLSDVKGTTVAQVDSSTVTTTISNTFTALGTQANLQTACLLTELTSGAQPVVYAEGTFGPDSLVSGNTIQITWSIART